MNSFLSNLTKEELLILASDIIPDFDPNMDPSKYLDMALENKSQIEVDIKIKEILDSMAEFSKVSLKKSFIRRFIDKLFR